MELQCIELAITLCKGSVGPYWRAPNESMELQCIELAITLCKGSVGLLAIKLESQKEPSKVPGARRAPHSSARSLAAATSPPASCAMVSASTRTPRSMSCARAAGSSFSVTRLALSLLSS